MLKKKLIQGLAAVLLLVAGAIIYAGFTAESGRTTLIAGLAVGMVALWLGIWTTED